jgi:hypothetical protein
MHSVWVPISVRPAGIFLRKHIFKGAAGAIRCFPSVPTLARQREACGGVSSRAAAARPPRPGLLVFPLCSGRSSAPEDSTWPRAGCGSCPQMLYVKGKNGRPLGGRMTNSGTIHVTDGGCTTTATFAARGCLDRGGGAAVGGCCGEATCIHGEGCNVPLLSASTQRQLKQNECSCQGRRPGGWGVAQPVAGSFNGTKVVADVATHVRFPRIGGWG